VIVDASIRRFQCQRCYLRAVAALRWINGRNAVLQGQRPHTGNAAQLQAVDTALRTVGTNLLLHPLISHGFLGSAVLRISLLTLVGLAELIFPNSL
jgi:hypothetical protein